jgi:hypothetical protein
MARIVDTAADPGRIKGGHMTQTQILEALRQLTTTERLIVLEAALQQIREDLQRLEQPLTQIEKKRRLAAAAEELLPDYAAGGELTIFTALDSEDFDEKG